MTTAKKKPAWPPPDRVFVVVTRALDKADVTGVELTRYAADGRVYADDDSVHEYRLVTKADQAAERAIELGEIGGFGVNPKDSAALMALREAIDDHLGWRNEKEEHAADYVGRVKQVAKECRVGSPCSEHSGSVHGKEAEELRKGVERILEEEPTEDIVSSLRDLLDSVDARDSLAFLEVKKPKRKPAKKAKPRNRKKAGKR